MKTSKRADVFPSKEKIEKFKNCENKTEIRLRGGWTASHNAGRKNKEEEKVMKKYVTNVIKLPFSKAGGKHGMIGKEWLRNFRCAAVCLMMMSNLMVSTALAAGEEAELKNAVATIGNSLYGLILGVSSVTAGVVIAWCLFTMLLSKDEHKVSSAMDWLKRAIICWVGIFLVATFMKWIVSATNGLMSESNTLDGIFGGGAGAGAAGGGDL